MGSWLSVAYTKVGLGTGLIDLSGAHLSIHAVKYLRIEPNWRLIAIGTLVVWLAGTRAMADTFNERKEELQQKIAQCFHHGIPSDNL